MKETALLILSFLLGSVPFGLVIAKAKGVDLRKVGSGNIGATNVMRGAGKIPAIITLLLDSLKGMLAVVVGIYFGMSPIVQGLMGLASILGHDFSIFLNFKGGKGVATSIGVILIYFPLAGILTIAIWLITAYAARYSSLGALVSFALMPFGVFFFYGPQKTVLAVLISLMIIVSHRDNIRRLLNGTERRIGEKD